MDERTLTALKGSIEKWDAIVAGTGRDYGTHNCPLCAAFYQPSNPEDDDCTGCPVREATGRSWCDGSPYDNYRSCKSCWGRQRAAKKELEFLRSLLPAESDA